MKISTLYYGDTCTVRAQWEKVYDACPTVEAFLVEVAAADKCFQEWRERVRQRNRCIA